MWLRTYKPPNPPRWFEKNVFDLKQAPAEFFTTIFSYIYEEKHSIDEKYLKLRKYFFDSSIHIRRLKRNWNDLLKFKKLIIDICAIRFEYSHLTPFWISLIIGKREFEQIKTRYSNVWKKIDQIEI